MYRVVFDKTAVQNSIARNSEAVLWKIYNVASILFLESGTLVQMCALRKEMFNYYNKFDYH